MDLDLVLILLLLAVAAGLLLVNGQKRNREREAEDLMRRVKEAELRYRGSVTSGNVRGSSDTHGLKRLADPQLNRWLDGNAGANSPSALKKRGRSAA